MKLIDLHVHSTASDGSLTPTEVVNRAAGLGLTAMALTDHDTVSGIDRFCFYVACLAYVSAGILFHRLVRSARYIAFCNVGWKRSGRGDFG